MVVSLQERCPPCVDDFLYICDDAYKREELIAMEMSILSTLKFDINIPIPYRFLRRFAKVSAFRGQAGCPQAPLLLAPWDSDSHCQGFRLPVGSKATLSRSPQQG